MNTTVRILLVAAVLALAAAGAYGLGRWLRPAPELNGTVLDEPRPVGHLELVAADGQRVALSEVAGTWTLVFFGFVDCPDVCPATMARLAETYRDLGEPEGVRVVMVTVDPERDDPQRLQEFVSGFHADFVGLGGSARDVGEAAKSFFIGFNRVGDQLAHTDAVALLDDRARLRAVYGQSSVRGIGRDLQQLLSGRRL